MIDIIFELQDHFLKTFSTKYCLTMKALNWILYNLNMKLSIFSIIFILDIPKSSRNSGKSVLFNENERKIEE